MILELKLLFFNECHFGLEYLNKSILFLHLCLELIDFCNFAGIILLFNIDLIIQGFELGMRLFNFGFIILLVAIFLSQLALQIIDLILILLQTFLVLACSEGGLALYLI
jgi:hypothetical protein